MEVTEIRDLDGPNRYMLQPAIAIEIRVGDRPDELDEVAQQLSAMVVLIHERLGLAAPDVSARALELPGHMAVAFRWARRSVALAIAEAAATLIGARAATADGNAANGAERAEFNDHLAAIQRIIAGPACEDDHAEVIFPDESMPRIIAVTGTNGKTTTTRLIAHILRFAGRSVGWTSTAGVTINGEDIETGDWSGPAGARKVLAHPGLNWAVLETARGGILRRGLAFQSADVTVFTNVSDDHLGDYGVLSIEELARVKGVVARVTQPDGLAVLNADDPLVLAQRDTIHAPVCLVSRRSNNPAVIQHIARGGVALWVHYGQIWTAINGETTPLVRLDEVPSTYGGRAGHMVENVLAAASAAIGCGLSREKIAAALGAFQSDDRDNPGRLNLYTVADVTVIKDYAHNEAGLRFLLDFARAYASDGARLITVIGTAGDRSDASLRMLGRMAATGSDHVVVKGTVNYLRGRKPGDMEREIATGVTAVGGTPWTTVPDELSALDAALSEAVPGDVIAMMCVDQPAEVAAKLQDLCDGTNRSASPPLPPRIAE